MVVANTVAVIQLEHERSTPPLRNAALVTHVVQESGTEEAPFEFEAITVGAALDEDV